MLKLARRRRLVVRQASVSALSVEGRPAHEPLATSCFFEPEAEYFVGGLTGVCAARGDHSDSEAESGSVRHVSTIGLA